MPKNDTPATVSQDAPEPVVAQAVAQPVMAQPVMVQPAPAPRQPIRIERQGVRGAPMVYHYPQVRGGICEWCGVLDKNLPSEMQYKLCPHFREFGQLRCSYCDELKNPDEVLGHSTLNVYEHPTRPGAVVVVCDSFECTRKHQQRFETAAG